MSGKTSPSLANFFPFEACSKKYCDRSIGWCLTSASERSSNGYHGVSDLMTRHYCFEKVNCSVLITPLNSYVHSNYPSKYVASCTQQVSNAITFHSQRSLIKEHLLKQALSFRIICHTVRYFCSSNASQDHFWLPFSGGYYLLSSGGDSDNRTSGAVWAQGLFLLFSLTDSLFALFFDLFGSLSARFLRVRGSSEIQRTSLARIFRFEYFPKIITLCPLSKGVLR